MSLESRQFAALKLLDRLYGPDSDDGPALLDAAIAERDRLCADPPDDALGAKRFDANRDVFVRTQLEGWFTSRGVHSEAIGWLVDCAMRGGFAFCQMDLSVEVRHELRSLDVLGRYTVSFGATEDAAEVVRAIGSAGIELWGRADPSGEDSRCGFTRRLVEELARPDELPRLSTGRIDRHTLFARIREHLATEAQERTEGEWREGPWRSCDDHEHRVAEFILATFDDREVAGRPVETR